MNAMRALLFAVAGCFLSVATQAAFEPSEVAVIINESDPLSVAIGEYYVQARDIPSENLIRTSFPADKPVLASATFNKIYAEVQDRTPPHVQAYALTWNSPIRVNCMSISSAFALGYATRYCAKGCKATAPNPYFNSAEKRPYTKFNLRPTMTIAARNIENAKFLIDRGVQSDYTAPSATAYLVRTLDKHRNARFPTFKLAKRHLRNKIPIEIVTGRGIRDKFDIMFYFTGTKRVPFLDTVGFLPGALADHLTSAGGRLMNSPQMSALEWLEAGATASYGTVVEPCNFPQKFPNPAVAMAHYLNGDSAIEAYWKSVLWPGQGIFIGEPLAKPFAKNGRLEP